MSSLGERANEKAYFRQTSGLLAVASSVGERRPPTNCSCWPCCLWLDPLLLCLLLLKHVH
jgi:hypothetical protein